MIILDKFNYEKYSSLKTEYKNIVSKISTIRMILFLTIVICFILGSKNFIFNLFGILFILLFIIFIFIHDIFYKKLEYFSKYVNILDQYESRINGNWRKFKDTGKEYSNQLFSDLDIVGDNSLFQLISICKTRDGKDKLIEKLSNKKISIKDIKESQKMVLELANNIDFDISFLVSLTVFDEKDVRLNDNFKYLDKNFGKRNVDFIIGIGLSFLSVFLLFLSIFNIIPFNFFGGIFVFNFLVNYMYFFIYRKEFDIISKISNDYSKLNNCYELILNSSFESLKLRKIKNYIGDSNVSIKKLFIINELNNLKNNILSSFIFNGLFCVNIMVMFLFSKFQKMNVSSLKNGIDSISEIEAMISIANVGIIRKNVSIPKIDNNVSLSFSNIMHPLIDEKICVGNDFSSSNGVNIITGSNMGGKTSFLRTIGINFILMNAGGYVCANEFSSCYMKIFTSMRVVDDIDKGISTFYGELLRIKNAMDYKSARLILIDEIFKGTNYNDRIYGAKCVIDKLNDSNTILFITTHDFELCDIKNIKNYYVKEYYEGDNICFDYKIRPGKATSTNAKYLMKKLNIID